MSPNNKSNNNNAVAYSMAGGNGAIVPRILGSSMSGIFEIAAFHPVDTCAKRLMSNQTKVYVPGNMQLSIANVNSVVFRDAANLGTFAKWKSMFPGLGFAAGYKIMQRTYKYGGQPFVKDAMNKNFGPSLKEKVGATTGKTLTSAMAGSVMGVGEVALLPLDVLKIKAQTAPETLQGRGVMDLIAKEGRGLYRGAGWTAMRNAPGSFALFGGSAFVHHSIFKLENTSNATFFQNFCASIGGAVASITVAAPLDVVKTRIQNKPFDAPESGVKIIRNIMVNEGPTAFFKGLTPKIIVVGPKLVFSFTIAQTLISYFEKTMA